MGLGCRTGLLLALCACAAAARGQDATLIAFNSQPGDYIGGGKQFTLTAADGSLGVSGTAGSLQASFNSSSHWWYLYFVPRSGGSLVPGIYDGATRWPFQSPNAPGLSVYGDGRGCNTLTGRFVILQAEYASGGAVQKLAIDYEQHCDGGAALFGSVRFHSNVALEPRLSVGSAAVYEGDSGFTHLTFVLSLSSPAASPVTVDYFTADGTASAEDDYGAVSGTATFPAGQTAVAVDVPVLGDTTVEVDETLALSLQNAAGAVVAFGSGPGLIRNDDPYKTLINFYSEPNDWVGGGAQFTLTPLDGTITARPVGGGVEVAFDGDTGWDLTFVPPGSAGLVPGIYEGVTRAPVNSPVNPGLDVSGNRGCSQVTGRFSVLEAIYGPGGEVQRFAADFEQHCEGANPALYGSVRFNSSAPLGPRLAVGSGAIYEGDARSTNLELVISLSRPASGLVTVDYATSDGTASAGSDYTPVSGTASFAPGETVQKVLVPVLGDTDVEADERFALSLSNPSGAPIAFAGGGGTLVNDDPYKTLLHFDSMPGDYIGAGEHFTLTPIAGTIVANREGNGVRVRFSGATWWNLVFQPPAGTTLLPGPYEGVLQPFSPPNRPGLYVTGRGRGCNSLTGRFTVLEAEYGPGGEVRRFAADFEQHCEGAIPALYGSVRIESEVALGPRLAVNSNARYEGDVDSANLQFVVSLSSPATGPVSVDYSTVDGSANAGSDYTAVSGTISFAAGQTVVVVVVPVSGDTDVEGDETFKILLSNAAGAAISFGEGQGTIRNDDPYKTLIDLNSMTGDPVGLGQHHLLTLNDGTITTQGSWAAGLGVHFAGAARWDLYFWPATGQTLAPGTYEGTASYPSTTRPALSVSGDYRSCSSATGRFTVFEAESGPTGAVLRFAADFEQHCGSAPALYGSVRINSAQPVGPRLAVSSSRLYEGDTGAKNLELVLSLSQPASGTVTVDYATADGTATAGSDYTPVSSSASFAPGQTAVTIDVPVYGDGDVEGDEAFTLGLSNAVGASIAFATGQGTILNDDPYKTLIFFNSMAGDYIGQGRQMLLTPMDGVIAASGGPGGVQVSFGGGAWWNLSFLPPSGATLTPGIFEGAERAPFHSPVSPGLEVYGDGRGCNQLTGRFTVLEVAYGGNGELQRFAADFEQHCEGGNPALYGAVRFNSSVPLGPRLAISSVAGYEGDEDSTNLQFVVSLSSPTSIPVTVDYSTTDGTATAGSDYTAASGIAVFAAGQTAVAVSVPILGDTQIEGDEAFTISLGNPAGAPIAFGAGRGTIVNDDPYKTRIYFNSTAGDYIGLGRQFLLTPTDGAITTTTNLWGQGGVQVHFAGSTWWDLSFFPPARETLGPGIYEGATRWPFEAAAEPGLDVSGDGRGCNMLTGRFTVLEAEYAASGDILRLAADYEQHCEGGGPALFGAVRINSAVPLLPALTVTSPAISEGNTGSRNLAFFVSLSRPATNPVTVIYATADGTATAGSDYTATSGVASFAPGDTMVKVRVPVLGDTIAEPDEMLTLALASPSNASASDVAGTGTILDDDAPLGYHTVPACRLLDTRAIATPIAANAVRTFGVGGACGVPLTAKAVALNVVALGAAAQGDLRIYSAGTPSPNTTVLHFRGGRNIAGSAVARLGSAGAVAILCDMPTAAAGSVHAVVDVYGYFE